MPLQTRYKYLEIGAERNRNTLFRRRFSDKWATLGISKKTPPTIVCNVDDPWTLPDARFELVYGGHVFEHATKPGHFLREAKRVLLPGGWLRLAVPDPSWLMKQYLTGKHTIDDCLHNLRSRKPFMHYDAYDNDKLVALFLRAGFSHVWTPPPKCSKVAMMSHGYFSTRDDRSIYIEGQKV